MQVGFSVVYVSRGLILLWRKGCVRARWFTCSQEAEKTQTPADFVLFCVLPQLGQCCPHAYKWTPLSTTSGNALIGMHGCELLIFWVRLKPTKLMRLSIVSKALPFSVVTLGLKITANQF